MNGVERERALHILLIEDDAGVGRVIRNGLRQRDIEVEWLRSAAQLFAVLERESHDVIILDLMLPDADGFRLCRDIRDRGIRTPICMLTARDALEDKLEGFEAGADDYLTKPFAIDELVARLQALLRRAPLRESHSPVEFGDLAINARNREAAVAGAALSLTRREFDLLLFLTRRPGEAVSREELLDTVWQADRNVTANAIDVYVGYLRRKLAGAASALRIEAVRGVGFRLL